jgi:hypothetical protein
MGPASDCVAVDSTSRMDEGARVGFKLGVIVDSPDVDIPCAAAADSSAANVVKALMVAWVGVSSPRTQGCGPMSRG